MAKYKIEVTADYLGHIAEIEYEFESTDQAAWEDLRLSAVHHWDSETKFNRSFRKKASSNPMKWIEMYVIIQVYEYDLQDPTASQRDWEYRAFFGKVFNAKGKLVGEYDIDFSYGQASRHVL